MSRAARRRAEREAKKKPTDVQKITLSNPVAHHFKAFIFANATKCDRVVVEGEAEGQSLLLCGAGPSLADNIDGYEADQVWGCNSALVWLHENGHRVTHGVSIDQTPAMVEEWATAPDVEYLLASTVHPHLTDYLLAKERRIRFFHNFVGLKDGPVELCGACGHDPSDHDTGVCAECECMDYEQLVLSYEEWMYRTLFPRSIYAGSGLNSVNRSLDIAVQMGFDKITVLGADCSLRVASPPPDVSNGSPEFQRWLKDETVMHADGGHALASGATPVTMHGEIDGRLWVTKPDMAISAVWLEQIRRHDPDRIEIIGDTLPNALRDKSDAFLARLPTLESKA